MLYLFFYINYDNVEGTSLNLNQRAQFEHKFEPKGTFVDFNNILDLLLMTELDRIGDVSVLEPFSRCHHCLVVLEYVLQFTDNNDEDEADEKYLWSKGDYAKISASILAIDWVSEFDGRSMNDAFLYLVEILQSLVDRFVPVSNQTRVPI